MAIIDKSTNVDNLAESLIDLTSQFIKILSKFQEGVEARDFSKQPLSLQSCNEKELLKKTTASHLVETVLKTLFSEEVN